MSKKRTHEKADTEPSTGGINTDGSLTRHAERRFAANYRYVIGIDEAGRGPLAGPVVAAACWVREGIQLPNIRDSKQTKECDREESFEEIMKLPASDLLFGVSIIDHKEIDEINILQATMKAMRCACEDLLRKVNNSNDINSVNSGTVKTKKSKTCRKSIGKGTDTVDSVSLVQTPLPILSTDTTIALIDGNRCPLDMPVPPQFVIKGDSIVYSIAVASIIAKVTRDRIMMEMHELYPVFNFAQHKGYPTLAHRTALVTHGPCPIHRLTYGPVAKCLPKSKDRSPSASTDDNADCDFTSTPCKRKGSTKVKKTTPKSKSNEKLNCKTKLATVTTVDAVGETPTHTSNEKRIAKSRTATISPVVTPTRRSKRLKLK